MSTLSDKEIDRNVKKMNAWWFIGGSFIGLLFAALYINKTTKVLKKNNEGENQWVNEPDGYDYTAITFTVLFAIAFIYNLYNLYNVSKPVS